MEPKRLTDLLGLAEKWKKVLEALMPESTIEIGDGIKSKKLLTWCFENKRPNGFNQSIQMEFYLDETVTVKTQHGSVLEELDSFEKAEKWISEYFQIPDIPSEPSAFFQTLPSLSERGEMYQKWADLLDKLKPYGVEVDTENEYRPFVLYLPKLESVMSGKGEFEHEDEGVNLEPGEDWAKLVMDGIINPLKELYAFSKTEIPDFVEELNLIQLDPNHKKLHWNMEGWINWIKGLSEKVPFKIYARDIWSALSSERYHFQDGKVLPGISAGAKNGIFSVSFEHEYSFNGDQMPIRAFSGKLYFFNDNVAVLEFSGTSLWGMRYRKEKFHLTGRYAGAKGGDQGNVSPEINSLFISGTWNEIGLKFDSLVETIDKVLGEGIRTLPQVVGK